jgi:hypothetical protein
MKKALLFGLIALVSATFALNAQNKIAFVGVYDDMSDLQLDDEDLYDAAVWFTQTYGGEYLPVSQITPAKLNEYAALWIYYDNDYLAAAPSEITDDPTVLDALTAYYKGGGNLLLCTYGNYLLKDLGRVSDYPSMTGTGTGRENGDGTGTMGLTAAYGTMMVNGGIFDRSNDPIYAGLTSITVTKDDGREYPYFPTIDGGWFEDHNCFWNMAEGVEDLGAGNAVFLTSCEELWGITALGTWGQVQDYFGACVARWHPKGDYQGTAITIGMGSYEWHANNASMPNTYLPNIQRMTKNALDELAGVSTSINNVKLNNAAISINNGILKIGGESVVSAGIYSANGALAGSYATQEINVSNLTKGVYIVRWIDSKGNTASAKFVK